VARAGFASPGPLIAGRGPVVIHRGPAWVGAPRTTLGFSTGFAQPFLFPHRRHHHRRFFRAAIPGWYYGSPLYEYPYYGGFGYPSTMDSYRAYDPANSDYAQNSCAAASRD
jgi:hypothetical protein